MKALLNLVRVLLAALREIFDEASYARFLRREHLASSPEAYAAFWDEIESGRVRQTKCC